MNKTQILEDRLIDFSTKAIDASMTLPDTIQGRNFASQLSRSASSVALNYGEARAGETRKDFIHKMKIVLKELRETHICLKLVKKLNLSKQQKLLDDLIQENDELISIFVVSIKTARSNANL